MTDCFAVQSGKEGEEVAVNPDPPDTVFISKCNDCKFSIQKRAAKCIIGRSCVLVE